MPLHLNPVDVAAELKTCKSVLIVSCPICPPVSAAADQGAPLIEFFQSGIKTRAYEVQIRAIRESLEKHGAQTTAFTSYAPCPAMCLWTKGQRKRLHKRARGCEAVLVMGCESARHTVEETLKGTTCKVILGMQLTGITNAALRLQFPLNVSLDNPAKVDINEAFRHMSP